MCVVTLEMLPVTTQPVFSDAEVMLWTGYPKISGFFPLFPASYLPSFQPHIFMKFMAKCYMKTSSPEVKVDRSSSSDSDYLFVLLVNQTFLYLQGR